MTTTLPPRHRSRDAWNGTWARRGLVYIPVIDERDEDDTTADMLVGILTGLADRTRPYIVTGVSCEDCGCLINDGELCPACVRPWKYAAEAAWNERRPDVYYTNKQRGMAA